MTVDRALVVALGTVDPALVTGVLGEEVAFVADPGTRDIANAVGAIVRADAIVDAAFLARATQLRVIARTGVGVDHVDLSAATARSIPVVITPGSGTRAVAEGVFALLLHLVKRLRPLTDLVRDGRWADRGQIFMGDLDGQRSASSVTDGSGGESASSPQCLGWTCWRATHSVRRRRRLSLPTCRSSPRQAMS